MDKITYPTAEPMQLNAVLPKELHEFGEGNGQHDTGQEKSTERSGSQLSSVLRLDRVASIKDPLMNEEENGKTFNGLGLLFGRNVNQRQSKNQSHNQDDCFTRKTNTEKTCDLPESNTYSRPNLTSVSEATQKQSEIEDNQRCYQGSESRHATEYDAAIPTENVDKFEKCLILPARNLRKQQEIVPRLGNPMCCIFINIDELVMSLLRSTRLFRINVQDSTDAKGTGPFPRTLCSTESFIGFQTSGLPQGRIFPHSRLQSITDQDSSQNALCETKNQTQFESLLTLPEGGGIQQPTVFDQLGTAYKCTIERLEDARTQCFSQDNSRYEDRGQYYVYLPEKKNKRQPWRGTILPYWTDMEDDVRLQLGTQDFEVEVCTKQPKAKQEKVAAKGKRLSLKEQRRIKSSMKKQQWARYRQAKAMVNSCYFDVESREEFRSQREQLNRFAETNLLPYYDSSAFPEGAFFDRPSANVGRSPCTGQLFDDLFSRTSLITKYHRQNAIERARKVHRQRCLNRERAYNEGREERTSANVMEQSRGTEKPDRKGLTEGNKEAKTLERMKQNKGDQYKGTESDLWDSDIAKDKSKTTKRKKTGKLSKEKRKEKRKANQESATVALGIDALKETEVVIDDSNFSSERLEEKYQRLEIVEQDDVEVRKEGKHENFNSNDRKDIESKIGNITTELVKAIGDRHSEEINSKNLQQVRKIGEQLKPIENVEEKNMEHQRVNHFPLETSSVVPKCYNSATECKEQNHPNQVALEHVICKTSQESSSRETAPTYPVDSVLHATYYRRPNVRVGLPRARVSAADKKTRSADWKNIQRGRQNETNWRWREDSAAAGDWACQNKAEMREAENQRSKRNHNRDQGDSDQKECKPYEEISVLLLHTDGHRITESKFNGRSERQRNRPQRKPRKERSRGHLSSSSLSSNWRSKKDEIENDSMKHNLQRKGSWEANNAVCESDRLCDPAVLVSPPKPEPHIRNRRLSPGSGIGGGGGGGCSAGPDQQLRQASPLVPEATLNGAGQPFAFAHSRERERRGHTRSRGPRRENLRVSGRPGDKPQRPAPVPKARWVEDSLSLLKPPPAFPVKDSPAKLQPAVSYASKVKAGGGASGGTEEPPGIGVLLQNQWGLSFISDGPAENSPSAAAPVLDPSQTQPSQAMPETAANHPSPPSHPLTGDMDSEKPALTPTSAPATPSFSMELCNRQDESSGELLLTCRHLVEAMQYHVQEWNTVYNRQKEDPVKVVWYKNSLEQPA